VSIGADVNTHKLYVSGNAQFNIGTSDAANTKGFTIYGNNRYLSFGGVSI